MVDAAVTVMKMVNRYRFESFPLLKSTLLRKTRDIFLFYLVEDHDILGGEKWPERSLKLRNKKMTRAAILLLLLYTSNDITVQQNNKIIKIKKVSEGPLCSILKFI